MSRVTVSVLVVSVGLLALAGAQALAGEAEAREGWTQVESVPAWVEAPPARDGTFSIVDYGRSNGLHLAYPDPDQPAAGRNVRLEVLRRLTPVLGAGAHAPAEAAGAAAQATEKVYLFRPAPRGRGMVVGGALYTAFVLWEVPFAPVLAAVPAEKKGAVARALVTTPGPAALPWKSVTAAPSWASDTPQIPGRLRVATKHQGRPWGVERVVAELQASALVANRIQGRLRPIVGNEAAFEIGRAVCGNSRLVERVHLEADAAGWQLWDVAFDDILAHVPASHRAEARRALEGPVPPKPWSWLEEVTAEPAWAKAPLAWPGHVPVVQVRRSNLPELAKQRSAKLGEADVAKTLAARLTAVLGAEGAAAAGARGARRREVVRKAIHDAPPAAGREAVPGARLVTVWTLWQVPLDLILEGVPEDRREAARVALTTR